MTWGRKNGDAVNCPAFPALCNYQRMDTTLRNAYLNLTANINGEVSPVSVVWNYIRQNYPAIELYQPDESHPSAEGSYAAACCFYAALFKKDPSLITFDFGLDPTNASIIRNAAKSQVFDSLQRWDFKKPPFAGIYFSIGAGINEVIFSASGFGFNESYLWNFGDGDTSSAPYSPHLYLADGTYTVTITTSNCDLQGLHTSVADTVIQLCSHTPTVTTVNPWVCNYDTLWTQPADSYQWFVNGHSIPETNQFVADYARYGGSGFSVIATVNGCAELSQQFTDSPVWSGYYFDGIGDPCAGDTVVFAVLHINGFLSGFENIFWFKNDTLLSAMTNEDTLLINSEGKYECKVVDPNSNCPLDTTYAVLQYDCVIAGIEKQDLEFSWTVYPNPASETIKIIFSNPILKEQIQIYNAIGRLTKVVEASGSTTIYIADLPAGLYFIHLKNNSQHPLRFIKQ